MYKATKMDTKCWYKTS